MIYLHSPLITSYLRIYCKHIDTVYSMCYQPPSIIHMVPLWVRARELVISTKLDIVVLGSGYYICQVSLTRVPNTVVFLPLCENSFGIVRRQEGCRTIRSFKQREYPLSLPNWCCVTHILVRPKMGFIFCVEEHINERICVGIFATPKSPWITSLLKHYKQLAHVTCLYLNIW